MITEHIFGDTMQTSPYNYTVFLFFYTVTIYYVFLSFFFCFPFHFPASRVCLSFSTTTVLQLGGLSFVITSLVATKLVVANNRTQLISTKMKKNRSGGENVAGGEDPERKMMSLRTVVERISDDVRKKRIPSAT